MSAETDDGKDSIRSSIYQMSGETNRTTAVPVIELFKMLRRRAKEPWPNSLGTGSFAYEKNGSGGNQRAACFAPQFRSDFIAPARRP